MIVAMFLAFLGVAYMMAITYYFMTWLERFTPDCELSVQEASSVVMDIFIAALLWPVVAPIANVHFFE